MKRWIKLRKVLENYPHIFPKDLINFAEFDNAWKVICSRAFGKNAPYISLAPVAELLNHGNVGTRRTGDRERVSPDFVREGVERVDLDA